MMSFDQWEHVNALQTWCWFRKVQKNGELFQWRERRLLQSASYLLYSLEVSWPGLKCSLETSLQCYFAINQTSRGLRTSSCLFRDSMPSDRRLFAWLVLPWPSHKTRQTAPQVSQTHSASKCNFTIAIQCFVKCPSDALSWIQDQ